MGIPIVRGPVADVYELCHCCVMIHKGDAYKDRRLVDQVNAAIKKPSQTVTYIQVTIKDHWEPEPAITIGPSIYGTFGAVCYNHVAAHDEEKYQAKKQEMAKAALAQKFSVDPTKL